MFVLTLLTTEIFDRDGDGSIFQVGGFDQDDFINFDFDNDGDSDGDREDRLAYRRIVAQWVANVVDFRDADSIMTGFEFDLNPFDGWDVDGDLATTDGFFGGPIPADEYFVVWGMERPELLITETLAMHDRRTEDLDVTPDHTDVAGGDPHFDSRLVPQSSVFFELYHPWVGGNQLLPTELENERTNAGAVTGVDLTALAPLNPGQTAPFGGAPVWRMVVLNGSGLEAASGVPDYDPEQPLSAADPLSIRRLIYFNQPPNPDTAVQNPVFEGFDIYHAHPNATADQFNVIRPGSYAIIGSTGQEVMPGEFTTFLGRDTTHSDGTPVNTATNRRIVLDTNNNEVTVQPAGGVPPETFSARVLPVVGPFNPDMGIVADRSLGLTDPKAGYPASEPDIDGEGRIFVDPMDTAIEMVLDEPADSNDPLYANVLSEDGLVSGAFVVLLQRLADPTIPHNSQTNPYLTVDSSGCDLFSFNGIADPSIDDPDSEMTPQFPNYFSSYERRNRAQTGAGQIEFGQDVGTGRLRMLWKTEFGGLQPNMGDTNGPSDGSHVLNIELDHSFGRLNRAYENAVPTAANNTELPFAFLPWNNRPFASALELANVPFTSSAFFPIRFDISQEFSNGMNPYNPMPNAEIRSLDYSGDFPHLLNFTANGNNHPAMYRLLDYVEVPSRYVGTERYVNPADYYYAPNTNVSISRGFAPPYDTISNYRVPGKLNINTIYDQSTWNALVGITADPNSAFGRVNYNSWQGERADRPFAPASSVYHASEADVPHSETINGTDTGLFRADGGNPMFDYDPQPYDEDILNSANRSPFFKYHERQRIANSITGRSSVFAVSIVIGYFEVEQQDNGDLLIGREYEDENFQTSRNRGFFIVDRSIPVAFEPGKNHNVERAIRLSSFIE